MDPTKQPPPKPSAPSTAPTPAHPSPIPPNSLPSINLPPASTNPAPHSPGLPHPADRLPSPSYPSGYPPYPAYSYYNNPAYAYSPVSFLSIHCLALTDNNHAAGILDVTLRSTLRSLHSRASTLPNGTSRTSPPPSLSRADATAVFQSSLRPACTNASRPSAYQPREKQEALQHRDL